MCLNYACMNYYFGVLKTIIDQFRAARKLLEGMSGRLIHVDS